MKIRFPKSYPTKRGIIAVWLSWCGCASLHNNAGKNWILFKQSTIAQALWFKFKSGLKTLHRTAQFWHNQFTINSYNIATDTCRLCPITHDLWEIQTCEVVWSRRLELVVQVYWYRYIGTGILVQVHWNRYIGIGIYCWYRYIWDYLTLTGPPSKMGS